MKECRHCHLEIPPKAVRCPHCGTDLKMNLIKRIFKGWGLVDFFLLTVALGGLLALGYIYLYDNLANQTEAWHIEAQAYEEVAGQVKVVGVARNLRDRTYTGNIVLELRAFDSQNKLIYSEFVTTQVEDVGFNEAFPFSFGIQRPRDFAFFNVIAKEDARL